MIGDFKFYEVGGKIRDELLGLTNKDVDYVAVPTDELFKHGYTAEQMFTILLDYLHSKKFEVFLVTEECLKEFLKDRGYAFVKEQMSDFIDYILLSSDAAYKQIRDNAISEFRESLNRAISDASWVLYDEDKLKIMIEVASEFCYT